MTTRSPLLELDFYMHRNNATLFSDVDIARSHHVVMLFWDVLKAYRDPDDNNNDSKNNNSDSKKTGGNKDKPLAIVLGSIACAFRKGIRPYQQYKIWTRILSWDERWICFVSHFVKKGAVMPRKFYLWGGSGRGAGGGDGAGGAEQPPPQSLPKDAILASVVSKNIFKRGRATMAPEKVLRAASWLPQPPQLHLKAEPPNHPSTDPPTDPASAESSSTWTWARVELERVK